MSKVSILITLLFLFLLMAFPNGVIKAQVGNELLKIKELRSDFSSDKIKIDLQAPSAASSLLIKLRSEDATETYPSNFDDKLGMKIRQVTITDSTNPANAFTAPVDKLTSLSSLRTGFGLMITDIPEGLERILSGGGTVNVEVQRELVDLASPHRSPDQSDWAKITGITDAQLEEQEQLVNSLLKASIKTAQPLRIQQQAQNQPGPGGAAAAPPAPPAPNPHCTPADIAAGKCTLGGGIPCDPPDPENPGFKTAIGCIHTNPVEFVKDFLKFIVAISGGLAFLLMLLGAFQMLTSAGNPDSLNAGRERLISAVIGLLFVIFAVLLMQIIGVGFLALPEFKP